ncbi:cell division protein ZipA [Halomonas beimenensis]|uniref:Cell division protein ZipA n=1 Tax=Halomonas beimenensis TaxID=475662 RepID=A0A291PB92_9GAMM|nr:cell division protein ZipA [Halomonas beimenensis]ATJ84119.1 cell division protein ZipA [Halomonas beimenensis]
MELREWLIILGLALVTLIVIDGVRRLQRQRRVPRLDQAEHDASGPVQDPEEAAREAEINWELPNGGARVVRPAEDGGVTPKPKLQRQDHPGPSRVLSEFRRQHVEPTPVEPAPTPARQEDKAAPAPAASAPEEEAETVSHPPADERESPNRGQAEAERREPALDASDEAAPRDDAAKPEPLVADPADHDGYDEQDYRLVDLEGMGDSLKSGSRRVGSSVQKLGASLQKSLAERRDQKRARREQEQAEKARREEAARQREEAAAAERRLAEDQAREASRARQEAAIDADDPLFTPSRRTVAPDPETAASPEADARDDDEVVRTHPVLEKALRHDVDAGHARDTLSEAEELIVISVMSREEEGFSGTALLDLMLACGLRYGRDMGIFHRFETEDPESRLQFSMVNVVKPGTFPIEAMDDFRTPGITLLMPLPGAEDTAAAFEAMVETAMVIVRHLGGELKDENMSVMTAQTVEFARQRVQEFERRHRLHRYQVN